MSRPKDWSSLEKAFEEKRSIAGVVTGLIKGGLTVDVGSRAFMPASRSGAKDAAEMQQLVGQEITCRIIKLDVADEDVVVDRRVVLEEEEARSREQRFTDLREGMVVRGTVRSLLDYGAFVDIGGIDGMLHVGEISWGRIGKPSDVLTIGQQVDVQILKVDPKKRRVSLGMKQLQPDPWSLVEEKYHAGDRVSGIVSRVADFGAFIELEPGHRRSDSSLGNVVVEEGAQAERHRQARRLGGSGDPERDAAERRISLGLKQALGDPWAEAEKKYVPGTIVEGPVTSLTKFGAFVQLGEDIEGMIHVGDISAEKRIDHPQDVLKPGQQVRAVVLEMDRERRRLRLGLKQLQPTSVDEYIAEHKEGDMVTGRVSDVSRGKMTVELGEGVRASCGTGGESREEKQNSEGMADLSALGAMLANKWKTGQTDLSAPPKREPAKAGQIRSFRIAKLDPEKKRIELELAS